jgi:hypothetical protein
MSTSWPSRRPRRDHDHDRRREQIADYGRLAIYAVLTAGTVWIMMQLPEIATAATRAEIVRTVASDQKIRDLCRERGLDVRAHEYTLCTMDLRTRRREEQLSAYTNFMTIGTAVR